MAKSAIPRRGRLSKAFLENDSVKRILCIAKEKPELDVQLRDGYFNIYVDGGNVLRVEQSQRHGYKVFFDKFYYYKNEIPKTYIEEVLKGGPRDKRPSNYPTYQQAKELIKEAEEKHSDVMGLLNEGKFEEYFQTTNGIVKEWVKWKRRYERRKQHIISCSNRNFTPENNLVVIDLEFAVSTNKPYNMANKVPKFDVIAVDSKGQIYCIELKDNLYADRDNSAQNIDAHKRDFDLTVGNAHEKNDFVVEMKEVVDLKKEIGLLPHDINVDTSLYPIFAIAYSGKKKEDIQKFQSKHGKEYIIADLKQINDNDIKINIL